MGQLNKRRIDWDGYHKSRRALTLQWTIRTSNLFLGACGCEKKDASKIFALRAGNNFHPDRVYPIRVVSAPERESAATACRRERREYEQLPARQFSLHNGLSDHATSHGSFQLFSSHAALDHGHHDFVDAAYRPR
jgi:hypothetical protein